MEIAQRLDADYIIHFDADGQHDPLDIELLLKPLLAGETDIVFGSRFLESKAVRIENYRPKKILLKSARWINYCFTSILLSDAHNGLRAIENKEALHVVKLNQAGMAHASESAGDCEEKFTSVQGNPCSYPIHGLFKTTKARVFPMRSIYFFTYYLKETEYVEISGTTYCVN